jgi:hypothetical protein
MRNISDKFVEKTKTHSMRYIKKYGTAREANSDNTILRKKKGYDLHGG